MIFILMLCLAGFRNLNVGVDTQKYYDIFSSIAEGVYWESVEYGWNWINRSISSFTQNFLIFLTIISFFTLAPVFYVSKKESPYALFSIFSYFSLHFYLGSFNIMRQYLGVSLIFLAFYLYKEKLYFKAGVLWLIAATIHHSCIYAIAIYFIEAIPLSYKKIALFLTISLIGGAIISSPIISIITFSEYDDISYLREDTFKALIYTILINIYVFFFVIISAPPKFLNSFWMKIFILSLIVLNLTYSLYFSARIYALFAISQIILFPQFIKESKYKTKIIPLFITFLLLNIQFWRMLLQNANNIIPYSINTKGLHSLYSFFELII